MADVFRDHASGLNSPANVVFTITLSDSVDLANPTRAIRADAAGVVKITCMDGSTANCRFAAGETRSIRALRVWLTGTTAGMNLEGMY
jgi:hypothetical protein